VILLWQELWRALLELIYPAQLHCPLCGVDTPENRPCSDCRQLLDSYAKMPICPVCGAFMELEKDENSELGADRCSVCQTAGYPFSLARALAPHEGHMRDAVHRFKYEGEKSLARPLAKLMADCALREASFILADALIPAPMHPQRELQRGYNQSLLLAIVLGEIIGKPVLAEALVKIRATPPQVGLSGSQRRHNLLCAFAVAQPELIQEKNILLVDDVFTTGSTVSILSDVLLQAGACRVQVITLTGRRQKLCNPHMFR